MTSIIPSDESDQRFNSDALRPKPYETQLGWPDRNSLDVGGLYAMTSGDCSVWEYTGVVPSDDDPVFVELVAPECDRFELAALTGAAEFVNVDTGERYAHRMMDHVDGCYLGARFVDPLAPTTGVCFARFADLVIGGS